jgi:hypothetical protein
MTAFGTAVSDYVTASCIFHAGTESMLVPTFAITWLKSALHLLIFFSLKNGLQR